ncbi:kinase-like domain-containing protein [Lasiosphaeria miniovina]|uniref:EKC/KEOPS complex subunit BUD32 n=1 Tax=Lasiosphaeria miniovina TaxID=1954250 RepID=A0AA39ZUA2_9PEZI|nr:kinase-like domain-containing protein [Lasiosphaeria miniovina]KAK0703859.1 kinase-like domain-containing protein [Lasiosphaeria miniovina]
MGELSPVLSLLSPQESFREFRDNGLVLDGMPFGLENICDYEPGGHHPVHLGDVLNGRYKVMDKLGHGGRANIWLCRDVFQQALTTQYFAVKVLMASASIDDSPELRAYRLLRRGLAKSDAAEHLCLPLGRFDFQGPNGRHFAVVYPVLGPRVVVSRPVSHLVAEKGKPVREARKLCFQAVKAMASLHSHGICHGDFRPANILMRIQGPAGLSEDELRLTLGPPRTVDVVQASGEGPWPLTAPAYLVKPIEWGLLDLSGNEFDLVTDKLCVVDFAESFDVRDLPEDLATPLEYCPPEYVLDKRLGTASDIWALGCTLFEIRAGRRLFDIPVEDPDEHLVRMVEILGKLPEPWWSTTWEARRRCLGDGRYTAGWPRGAGNSWLGDESELHAPPSRVPLAKKRSSSSSIEDLLAGGLVHDFNHLGTGNHDRAQEEEMALFADLLRRIFKYVPEQRISAEGILEHPWFAL